MHPALVVVAVPVVVVVTLDAIETENETETETETETIEMILEFLPQGEMSLLHLEVEEEVTVEEVVEATGECDRSPVRGARREEGTVTIDFYPLLLI